jgi:hypothetical protein
MHKETMDQCDYTVIRIATRLDNRLQRSGSSLATKYACNTVWSPDLTRPSRVHSHLSRTRVSQSVACEHLRCTENIISHRRDQNVRHIKEWNDFTFSEPCIVIHIRENGQQDAQFIPIQPSSTCFEETTVHQAAISAHAAEYFTMHLWGV